jgi:hypothetical protein
MKAMFAITVLLFFKIFFIYKYIKILFFLFFKIIFNINILKQFKNI